MECFIKQPPIDLLRSAVSDCIFSGATVAIGGQNMLRNPVAISLEIAAQKISGISLVGCNLSVAGDILVASGSVSKISCGSMNFEVFGIPEAMRVAAESERITIADQDHHTILSRVTAARLGSPFVVLPFSGDLSWLGTLVEKFPEEFVLLRDAPFLSQDVVLATPLRPDVFIAHVQAVDDDGNLYVRGPECFDFDLALASKCILVTCEEMRCTEYCRETFGRPMLPGAYINRAIPFPGGARPTSVPGFYPIDVDLIGAYIQASKVGGDWKMSLALLKQALFSD